MQSFSRYALLSVAILTSSCSTLSLKPPEPVAENYSSKYPVRTLTGFTSGLACMDKMFIERKVAPVYIAVAAIPDYSENRGSASYAAKDMLISAISEMNKESAVLRLVAFDRQTPDIVALHSSHPQKASLRVPDFFIRGSVTQINTAPYSLQRGGSANIGQLGTAFQGAGISSSSSLALSSVSLDLGMGMVKNFQMLPGVFSSNTFSVEKRGSSDQLSISLNKFGAVYSASENTAEALSSALRALVEVGLIEVVGKLYNLPYWDCLATIGDATPEREDAYKLYADMSKTERANYLLEHLKRLNLIDPAEQAVGEGGKVTMKFREALMHYRVLRDVFGGTDVDFRIFEQAWKEINLSRTVASASTALPVPSSSGEPTAEPKILVPKEPAPMGMKVPETPGAPLFPPVR